MSWPDAVNGNPFSMPSRRRVGRTADASTACTSIRPTERSVRSPCRARPGTTAQSATPAPTSGAPDSTSESIWLVADTGTDQHRDSLPTIDLVQLLDNTRRRDTPNLRGVSRTGRYRRHRRRLVGPQLVALSALNLEPRHDFLSSRRGAHRTTFTPRTQRTVDGNEPRLCR